MQDIKDLLLKEAEKISLSLSETQLDKFQTYLEFLVETNEKVNLTAITQPQEVVMKHFIDSIALFSVYDIMPNAKIADVGTGAGFPGRPLKIYDSTLSVTLVDSLNKRINFLNEVISELGLTDVETVHSRAEELAKNKDYRESYDYCVSRAVANLATLSELCLPFVKVGGYFVSLKGPKAKEEIAAAKKAVSVMGGSLEEVVGYSVDKTDYEHNLVIIKKASPTPARYPRNAPKPAKDPIG